MCHMLGVTQGRKDIFSHEKLYTYPPFCICCSSSPLVCFTRARKPTLENIHVPSCVQNLKHNKSGELLTYITLPKSISTSGFTLIERDPEAQPYK